MARSRNIKPGFFLNFELGSMPPLARLLFAGLWVVADREGRLEDKPARIKAQCLPYDDCDVEQLLTALEGEFIARYSFGGKSYIQILNWKRHQTPHHKEVASMIPSMTQEQVMLESSMTHPRVMENASCPTDSLNLIPLTLNPSIEHDSNPSLLKFQQFWQAYPPNRDGKKPDVEDCRRAFVLLPPHQQDQVLFAVSLYVDSSEVKGGFTKSPLRFIEKAWPDWLEPAKPTSPPAEVNKPLSRAEIEEMNRRHAEISNRHRRPAVKP